MSLYTVESTSVKGTYTRRGYDDFQHALALFIKKDMSPMVETVTLTLDKGAE